ncbi:hypothetical protein FSPOR_1647 [Fusarium sporotrichioides]|uniref:Uncharacterized protein n=1 Tax=Fusarium sporotrichioides TaxID=5514 RepID=A0A395SNC2_FUSSP|nr:hypothetical protein FSPOR_1647 [Fusarium sporotrichioides]
MSSSSDYSDAVKAQLRAKLDNEVAVFLQRLQSVGVDDEVDDFEIEDIGDEARRLHGLTGSGSSSSSKESGASKDKIPYQVYYTDDVSDQIQTHLEKKKLAKKKRDKKAQIDRLEETMAELNVQRRSLLNDAEIKRLSHNAGDISTDIEMTKILEQYRVNGMKRCRLDAERQSLEYEIWELGKEKR